MFVALVAQRIEQKTSNLLVAGSIPAEGASWFPLSLAAWNHLQFREYLRSNCGLLKISTQVSSPAFPYLRSKLFEDVGLE